MKHYKLYILSLFYFALIYTCNARTITDIEYRYQTNYITNNYYFTNDFYYPPALSNDFEREEIKSNYFKLYTRFNSMSLVYSYLYFSNDFVFRFTSTNYYNSEIINIANSDIKSLLRLYNTNLTIFYNTKYYLTNVKSVMLFSISLNQQLTLYNNAADLRTFQIFSNIY